MKTTIILFLTLLSLTASCQWGLKGGIAVSYFAGGGDDIHNGISNAYGSIVAGFFKKWHHWQGELEYRQQGAKNPKEGDHTFKTHYISLPVTYIAHCGDWNFQGGMYVSRLVAASNYDFFAPGPSFGWDVSGWDFWDRWDYGLVAGVGVKLEPLYIEIHGRYGIPNVRNELQGWDGRDDYNYWNCHNASADISLYVPFSIFGK